MIVASPDYLARAGTPKVPEDLHAHNCLNFNFRRAEPTGRSAATAGISPCPSWTAASSPQWRDAGSSRRCRVGITRVGRFSVAAEIADGRLVPLLEDYNPGDVELIHAVFVGGSTTPARVRVFVDFLVEP